MPITLPITDHDPQRWKKGKVNSIEELFQHAFRKEHGQGAGVVQSSITRREFRIAHISPSNNGFVWALLHAYSGHHHLILRPDDVWLAIISQLSFFFNAHSKELRIDNVKHEGRKELCVDDAASLDYSDFGVMSARMNILIHESLTSDLQGWIMPDFSTTTEHDIVATMILMMGTQRKVFNYTMHKKCGIPSVTLLGERKDWDVLMVRVQDLWQFGSQHLPIECRYEPSVFGKLLQPVIRGFQQSFEAPNSASVKEFWARVASPGKTCDPVDLSGWATAFCFWDEYGRRLYGNLPGGNLARKGCVLDGVQYHAINVEDIPSGVASLVVAVNDKDELYRARMFAGSLGVQASRSCASEEPGLNSLQPLTGWFMSEMKSVAEEEEEAPPPRPFVYYDGFDEEAPLPAPFIYEEIIQDNDSDGEKTEHCGD
ncbi:hypothetical protein N0V90_005687 [Kalmusia sp. IMI 367209]|nr:hypothetical protein N0V90_005687 [Kalmusia sp. IMI 367209]